MLMAVFRGYYRKSPCGLSPGKEFVGQVNFGLRIPLGNKVIASLSKMFLELMQYLKMVM